MNLPHGFLTSEKAPFIVTLFIAALAWTAIRTADRLSGTPFIEYRVGAAQNEKGVAGIELRFRNITKASRFDCFRMTIATRQQETLQFGEAGEQRHRIRGTVLALLNAKRTKPQEWEIEATNFAPGADIAIFVPAIGSGEPLVLVQPCVPLTYIASTESKKSAESSDDAKSPAGAVPVLFERGVITFFVEHEIAMLWSALLLWLLLLLPSIKPVSSSTRTIEPTQASKELNDDVPR